MSRIEYADIIYDGLSQTDVQYLQRVQTMACVLSFIVNPEPQ